MFIGLAEWFRLFPITDFFEEDGDHAGEMETSIMLHYFPELVLPLDQAGDGKSKKTKLNSVNKKIAWAPRRWDKISEDTGIGNPRKATAEKGKKYLDRITSEIADFLTELAGCDPVDIYEG